MEFLLGKGLEHKHATFGGVGILALTLLGVVGTWQLGPRPWLLQLGVGLIEWALSCVVPLKAAIGGIDPSCVFLSHFLSLSSVHLYSSRLGEYVNRILLTRREKR